MSRLSLPTLGCFLYIDFLYDPQVCFPGPSRQGLTLHPSSLHPLGTRGLEVIPEEHVGLRHCLHASAWFGWVLNKFFIFFFLSGEVIGLSGKKKFSPNPSHTLPRASPPNHEICRSCSMLSSFLAGSTMEPVLIIIKILSVFLPVQSFMPESFTGQVNTKCCFCNYGLSHMLCSLSTSLHRCLQVVFWLCQLIQEDI